MAILGWGKCKIKHTTSTNGAPAAGANWEQLPTPKQDTTKVVPTAGAEKVAYEEGGDIVDVRYDKTTYQLEFDLYVKKGEDRPFEDNDGIIDGEHAFRVIPEDESNRGCQIDRSVLRVEENFTTAEGFFLHYVAKVLKPAAGKSVKPYTESAGS